jgi:hypothetical protein
VSSIDPIVILDIGLEDLHENTEDPAMNDGIPRSPSDLHSLPSSPALGATRFSERFENTDRNSNANVNPVVKLMKNLAIEPKKRILTTVLFGEHNPILVVGDNRGNVTVYRVFDPVTITNLGPLQQFLKLKEAVVRQTDPQHSAVLENDNGGYLGTSLSQPVLRKESSDQSQ